METQPTQPKRQRPYAENSSEQVAVEAPRNESRNRRFKGIVAIGLGAVLLSGGATTLAYWSSEQNVLSQGVQTGSLSLALVSSPVPNYSLSGFTTTTPLSGSISTLNSVRLVPGDVLTYVQPVEVTMVGTTLKAALEADIKDGTGLALLKDARLLDVNIDVKDATNATVANPLTAIAGTPTRIFNVTVEVVFHTDSTNLTESISPAVTQAQTQGVAIGANDISLTLKQITSP